MRLGWFGNLAESSLAAGVCVWKMVVQGNVSFSQVLWAHTSGQLVRVPGCCAQFLLVTFPQVQLFYPSDDFTVLHPSLLAALLLLITINFSVLPSLGFCLFVCIYFKEEKKNFDQILSVSLKLKEHRFLQLWEVMI